MPVEVGIEAGAKKVFAWVIDQPGWCRSGRTETDALDALVACRDRYAAAADVAGLDVPSPTVSDLVVVERLPGSAGTDFGVPSAVGPSDGRPTDAAMAKRLAALVEAAWLTLDRVIATAPDELRKGPRGGGRDRDKVFSHTLDADLAYAQQIGLKGLRADPTDRATIETLRAAMLDVLRTPTDGSPIAGRRWPAHYAARRIAWHALDHAWEIEDRSDR